MKTSLNCFWIGKVCIVYVYTVCMYSCMFWNDWLMEECFIFKAISVDTCGWIKGHPTTQHDPSILHPFFIHPASFLLIHYSSFIFLSSQPSFSFILHLIFHPSFLLRCHNSFLPYFYSSFITYLIHFSFSFLISHSVSFILSFFFQENQF